MPSSVQGTELVWTTFMVVGLLANGLLLWRSLRDRRAVRRDHRNGARRIVTRTKIGVHGMLTTMQLLGVVIGAVALTQPSGDARHPAARLAILWGLLLYGLIPSILGLWWQHQQRLLLSYLTAADRAESILETQHTETMHELHHNTEISEKAKEEAEAAHEAAARAAKVAAAVSDEIRTLVKDQRDEGGDREEERDGQP